MYRLPVSKLEVDLRFPTGREELLLLEARGNETCTALDLLARLAEFAGDASVRGLPVADMEYLLLALRRLVLGESILSVVRCPQPGCRAQIDVDFPIGEYCAHHKPAAAPDAEQDGEGWYRLRGEAVRFRLPLGSDQEAALRGGDAERELIARCVEPAQASRGALRRVERAIARMAPLLSQELSGKCPECGVAVRMYLDVQSFVLQELRSQALGLYEEVGRLAKAFHWPEESILAMPAHRRMVYSDLAAGSGRLE
ncbi:MAG: hypothetical protein IT165_32450 [Bryobacterales bacterium]|nr:hypothetical protein [Bryobacterales bacterium]